MDTSRLTLASVHPRWDTMGNRRHSKINRTLPQELVEMVNQKLVGGHTYKEITEYLSKLGHEISQAAIGRYGKDFLSKLEKLKLVKEQARAILTETDGLSLEMEEASVQIALQKIMEFLMELDDLQGEKASKIMTALARLQSSSVSRERLKMDFRRKAQEAAEDVQKIVKQNGLSDAAVEEIRNRILGISV